MSIPVRAEAIEYLVIGHIALDLLPQGNRLGGTAAYAALTAQTLGLRPGIVTHWGAELTRKELTHIPIAGMTAEHSTSFENVHTGHGRAQYVHAVAPPIHFEHIPTTWRAAPIVHLGPIAQEIDPAMADHFSGAFVGVTPQGWLRTWDDDGRVSPRDWQHAAQALRQADAVVLSIEDLAGEISQAHKITAECNILALTMGKEGALIFWNGDERHFSAPPVEEVDPTGAGDIFAASFFCQLWQGRNPWEAAQFANQIAAHSVHRCGLKSSLT